MDIGTIIQNPSEDEPTFYLLMSERDFCAVGGGGGSQRRKEKQFYKFVLQLDLLTQYPKTLFLPLSQ